VLWYDLLVIRQWLISGPLCSGNSETLTWRDRNYLINETNADQAAHERRRTSVCIPVYDWCIAYSFGSLDVQLSITQLPGGYLHECTVQLSRTVSWLAASENSRKLNDARTREKRVTENASDQNSKMRRIAQKLMSTFIHQRRQRRQSHIGLHRHRSNNYYKRVTEIYESNTRLTLNIGHVTGWLKMPDMKLQDMKMTDQITGHEFARHDKYHMKKIDYITLDCAFLLHFKSFICKASVLTYKKNLTAPAHHKYSSSVL